MRPMGIGAQRINLAAMLDSSRVIALAEVLGTAPVLAELELVREVAVLEPAAARELETGPVGAELELRTVRVAEPETVLVEAVLVQSQPHAQLAVPLRIKSATAARRPGQVPLLAAEEDLAAVVAEITHGQAATEAATAWAAAE